VCKLSSATKITGAPSFALFAKGGYHESQRNMVRKAQTDK
jgi:hypothetical protein